MKSGPYFVVLLLTVAGVVLTVALILVARTNQQLQVQLQAQQQALSQGVLGQQVQQISAGVLQDLARVAAGNPAIRQLLAKYGYRVTPAAPEAQLLRAGSRRRRYPVSHLQKLYGFGEISALTLILAPPSGAPRD